MTHWKKTTDTLHGLTVLKHSQTGELCAFGDKGQLFAFNATELRALQYIADGSESISTVPSSKAKSWAKRFAISSSSAVQLRLANS